ncbi:MAG: translesion DNA synthesis-associated protein ImuA [Deltaproteobacteria bacterium]|nr:translesion DNA synthesis-associated protein ImuA [Deltaproteobacteria bacterium]
MKEALQALLGHPDLWLGDGRGAGAGRAALPTGFAALDALLPGGGWPAGAVTEILLSNEGIGEMRLLLPALVGLGDGRRIAWIDPPYLPYAPALAASGLRLSRVLVVYAGTNRDRLWAAELALRSGACGAVLAWPGECDDRSLRRLTLAAEKGGCLGLLFRPSLPAGRHSPAALRLRLAPSPRGVMVEVLKGRGRAGRSAEVPLARISHQGS